MLGLAGLGGRGPAWMVPLRAGSILVVGVALQGSAGGAGGWFAVWPFVLVAVYPLALPEPAGLVVAGLALAEVGQSYPAACQAAAAAGYDGLEPAANGVRAVLAGEASLFRCRYQAPDGTRPYEVTVTPLAEGDGAVVSHRPSPPAVS